jgi:hypothetical protein
MPPEAFPPGNRLVPGAHATLELAWYAMGYQMLVTGTVLGALAMLALFLFPMLRKQYAQSLAHHLKGMADGPHQ